MKMAKAIESTVLCDEKGTQWELRYYAPKLDEPVGEPPYGLRIEQQAQGTAGILAEETRGLTHSYDQAADWARKLAKGKVLAMSLYELADDFTYMP